MEKARYGQLLSRKLVKEKGLNTHVVKKKAPKKVARRRTKATVGMACTGTEGRMGGEVECRD